VPGDGAWRVAAGSCPAARAQPSVLSRAAAARAAAYRGAAAPVAGAPLPWAWSSTRAAPGRDTSARPRSRPASVPVPACGSTEVSTSAAMRVASLLSTSMAERRVRDCAMARPTAAPAMRLSWSGVAAAGTASGRLQVVHAESDSTCGAMRSSHPLSGTIAGCSALASMMATRPRCSMGAGCRDEGGASRNAQVGSAHEARCCMVMLEHGHREYNAWTAAEWSACRAGVRRATADSAQSSSPASRHPAPARAPSGRGGRHQSG
jgi:hypothetical protein